MADPVVTVGGRTRSEANGYLEAAVAPAVAPNPSDSAPKAVPIPGSPTRVDGTSSHHPQTGKTIQNPGPISP